LNFQTGIGGSDLVHVIASKAKQSCIIGRCNPIYIYILTNVTNRVLYTGVTSDLIRRVYTHKQKLVKGFSAKYNLNKLVYFETHEDIKEAIKKEKLIKGGSREKKLKLIESINPDFEDLYPFLIKS